MLLVSDKTALFDIAISSDAHPAVRYAAEELQHYVEEMSLARPRIRTDARGTQDSLPKKVLVGESTESREPFPKVSAQDLARESYLLRTRGSHLLLLGGSPRGTLYAVYDFLGRLGVRWWTPTEETVPLRTTLEVGPLRARVDPPLIYRAIWYRHTMDADWQARQRLNAGCMTPIYLAERHGGAERFAMDASSHTYEGLVPTEDHFDEHPDYFSEVNGVRLRYHNQLCPTHPDVAELAAATAREWLRQTPDARLLSVTQNDHGNWCTCTRCSAMIEREGSPSGPMLHLANEVAKRLEKDFPDVLIDTFGYSWSEKPPSRMKARPNVVIRFAPIGNCFGHSIHECPANAHCRDDLAGWSRGAKHLFVWHYVTDFCHYLTPFPNLPPLADDINTYLEHGVKGIFLQADGTSLGGDMAELKAYLMVRLLWDPSTDVEEARAEFLAGYYREAAPAVEEYVASFEKAFARAGHKAHLHLYRTLWENDAPYLTQPVLSRARNALERGYRKASDDPEVVERLDRIRLGLDYTELFYYERPRPRSLGQGALTCRVSPRRRQLLERLFQASERSRITHYGEDLGRYTTMGSLRRAWLESTGGHEVVRIEGGGAGASVVPALGGRIVDYRVGGAKANLLGEGSPQTFGYPCCGGYEEYCLRAHQSPGFSESHSVVRKTMSTVELRAETETGLTLKRRVRLGTRKGEVLIRTSLANRHDSPLPGCLRCHLEINLGCPVADLQWWTREGRTWTPQDGEPSLAWYEDEVPSGWAFWSGKTRTGIWQTWSRDQIGAVFLGGVPSESAVLALDLARGRSNEPIAPGECQEIAHRFGGLREPPGK